MPNDNFGYGLANLLAGAAKGYFRRKYELSAEEQKWKKEEQDRLNSIQDWVAKTKYQATYRQWESTGEPELAQLLGISPEAQRAKELEIQELKKKEQAAAGEKKPSIGEATKGLFETLSPERSVTTQAPVFAPSGEGGYIKPGQYEKTGYAPIGETKYTLSPEAHKELGIKALSIFDKVGGKLPEEVKDEFLKAWGIQPKEPKPSTAGQVTERDVFNSLKSTIITDINSLSNQRDEIEKNKGLNQKLGIDQSAQLNEINNLLKLRKRQLVEFTTTGRTKIKNEKDFMQWYHGKIIRTGIDQSTGKKVVKYEDGTIDYAE